MTEHPILVPGLACTVALSRHADITVADHTVADAILTAAPPRFALVGLSMGGSERSQRRIAFQKLPLRSEIDINRGAAQHWIWPVCVHTRTNLRLSTNGPRDASLARGGRTVGQ